MRRKNVSGRCEDYLRALYEIVERKGYARIRDISKKLGVKPSTTIEMMKKLQENGLVNYEKYGGVTLTPSGKRIAEAVKKRHDTFKKFLEIILVPEETALRDAHLLEHELDPKTILQFTRFVEFITEAETTGHPRLVKRWIEQFKRFCEEEEKSRRI